MSINLCEKLGFNYSKRVSSFFYNNNSRIKGLFGATEQKIQRIAHAVLSLFKKQKKS